MTIEELISKLNLYGPALTFLGQMIIASIAIGVAICGETMKTWYRHTDLKLVRIVCHEQKAIVDGIITNAYYYRLIIKNFGRLYAEKAEVFAKELRDYRYEKIETFIPRRFKWTNIGNPIYDIISPGTEKHCELLHFIDPKYNKEKKLDLDLEILTVDEFKIVPTTYYMVIQITSANSKKPIEKILRINHTGGMNYAGIKIDILKNVPNLSYIMSRPIKLAQKELIKRKIMKIWSKINWRK